MPEISVIAPVYGVEQYIHQFMDSVLAQTFHDFEFIVVDDGSKDNCPAILDEYGKRDSRIKVIHQKNGGVSVARNTGIEAATGKYVYIVDSDDWLEPNALEVLYRDAVNTGADCVMGDCMLQQNGKQYRRKQFSKRFFTEDTKELIAIQQYILSHKYSPYYSPLCVNGYAAPWGKFVKMSLIKEYHIRFEPKTHGYLDDLLYSLTIAQHMCSFCYSNEYVYNYRINNDSITQKFNPRSMEVLKNSLNLVESYIHEAQLENRLIVPFYNYVVRHLIVKLKAYFFNQNRTDKTYRDIRREILTTIKEEPYRTSIKSCRLSSFDAKKQIFAAVCFKMHWIFGLKMYIQILKYR